MPVASSPGKPLLFFSAHHADKEWRLKEKLVAVIESYLQPVADPYTFSNARLLDVIGSTEEVDVAFSTTGDPRAAFSFVEVRDRNKKVGRPYIQQIIGKMKTLGVHQCAVVSTRGFAQKAIRLAEHEGIRIRVLSRSTPEKQSWYTAQSIEIRQPVLRIDHGSVLASVNGAIQEFTCAGDQATLLAPTADADQYRAVPLARIFEVDFLGRPETRRQVWERVPKDGQIHRATYSMTYKTPVLQLECKGSRYPVGGIVYFAEIGVLAAPAPVADAYEYIDGSTQGLLAQLILAPFSLGGQQRYACLVRHSCDGERCKIGGAFFG